MTSDKPLMKYNGNHRYYDAGAAPVGHQLQRLPIGCQPTSTSLVVQYVPAEAGTNLLFGGQRHVHVKQLAQGCYTKLNSPKMVIQIQQQKINIYI